MRLAPHLPASPDLTGVGSAPSPGRRDALLRQLADRIRRIELARPEPVAPISFREAGDGGDPTSPSLASSSPPLVPAAFQWSTGDAAVDACLAPQGLDDGATYEIKPERPSADRRAAASLAACEAAAQAFALWLAIGRAWHVGAASDEVTRRAPLLWCQTVAREREIGRPYGPGLADLGFDPSRLILAVPQKLQDALWVAEEALKSESFAAVVVTANDVALTPARRLALAARAHRTPCLLLTAHDGPPAASALYRWRIGPASGAPHRFEAKAPGAARLTVKIERIRSAPATGEGRIHVVEWSDETHRIRLAAGLASRPVEEGRSWRRAG